MYVSQSIQELIKKLVEYHIFYNRRISLGIFEDDISRSRCVFSNSSCGYACLFRTSTIKSYGFSISKLTIVLASG